MTAPTELATPVPAAFHINEVATVPVSVVAAGTDGGLPALTIEAEPAAWESIDLGILFHLGWDQRGDGEVSGALPVQIVIRLDPDAVDPAELPTGATELAAAVASAPDDSPLRFHGSWYALEVTEPVELPAELDGTGDVRTGFTTIWADA